MEVRNDILLLKELNGNQKLVLGVIANEFVPSMKINYCELCSQEIADKIGMTHTKVANTLWELNDYGYIKTVVEDRKRTTKITALLKRAIKANSND